MSKPIRVGSVSITANPKGGFVLRYTDPATKKDVRRIVPATSAKEAREVATHINRQILIDGGFLPSAVSIMPPIKEMIDAAIDARNTLPATNKERKARGRLFADWMKEEYPEVRTFEGIKPAMLQAYVVAMERRKLAYDTVRLHLAPIKLAWRYAQDNFPDLVRPLPRLAVKPAPPREIECLNPAEVSELLDWLRTNDVRLHAMVTLQVLCGLRMFEAAALREQDVNFKAGTITITDTGEGGHKPKTRESYRTIPVLPEVLAVLKNQIDGAGVRRISGEIFFGRSMDRLTYNTLMLLWRRRKKAMRKDKVSAVVVDSPAHRLRASFATMAKKLGVDDRILKAYIGHSSGDVIGGHYIRIGTEEMRGVPNALKGWRGLIPRQDSVVQNS